MGDAPPRLRGFAKGVVSRSCAEYADHTIDIEPHALVFSTPKVTLL